MLDARFRSTGVSAHIDQNANLTRFQVLGERSSGTNLVKRLLGRNTSLAPTEALGWKHGFAQETAIPSDLLVVCVVRRADAWALSMHAKPWHCPPAMQALPFSQFIRAKWDTIVDRPRYFRGLPNVGEIGTALRIDRHPQTGQPFETVFDMRTAKLRSLLSYPDRDCNCVVLRCEDVVGDPNKLLEALSLPGWTGHLRPVFKRLGSKFRPSIEERPSIPDCLSEADTKWLKQRCDTKLEATLGYEY